MALVSVVKKWRPYLLGKPFMVRTDHQSLKFLLEQKVGTPGQQKWITKLMGYAFAVEYKKGVEHKVADAISRKEDLEQENISDSKFSMLFFISFPNLTTFLRTSINKTLSFRVLSRLCNLIVPLLQGFLCKMVFFCLRVDSI